MSKPVDAEIAQPGNSRPEMWDAIGACWDEDDRYVLRVCPFVDYSHATETLIHEWAHLRRYEQDPSSFDLHDDAYWLELGRIYRDFFPDDEQ